MPIIQGLIKANFTPVLASDGDALTLLKKEFPLLKSYELPSYNIKYSKEGKKLKQQLLLSIPSIISAVKREGKLVSEIIEHEDIYGLISDNRFGVHSNKIPSVYITHQLNVLSGNTTFITSKIHQRIIKKFDECWVPDNQGESNLSGKLGHLNNGNLNLKYIGVLSRFNSIENELKYDLLVLLSGPEPQRTLLENKLLKELKNFKGIVMFVRGVLASKSIIKAPENFKVVNYLLANNLEKTINESDIVIARSGYSTVMDLSILGKKAFFIPTPGQFEQEYLAKQLSEKSIAPFSNQECFKPEDLKKVADFKGFKSLKSTLNLDVFSLFNRK